MKNHWTDEQDAILRDLYPTTCRSELERRLGHSYNSLKGRASALGIKRLRTEQPLRSWTLEELYIIRRLYPQNASIAELCDALPRHTWSHIQSRAVGLGLRRTTTNNQTELVCQYCDKTILRTPSKTHQENFCSHKCYSLARQTRISHHCDNCGKQFDRIPSAISWKRKFCSTRCYRLAEASQGIESTLATALSRYGVIYTPQFPINGWHIDLAITSTSPKIAIECDGDFWHGHKHSGGLFAAQRKTVDRDQRVNVFFAQRSDWILVRFKESEINSDVPACASRVVSLMSPIPELEQVRP